MRTRKSLRRGPSRLLWRAAPYAAVLLAAGVLGVLSLRLARGEALAPLLPLAGLALTASAGTVWYSRARARGRLKAALDAFAEREITRQRRQALQSSQPSSRRPAPRKLKASA
jgi:hypothetical protein